MSATPQNRPTPAAAGPWPAGVPPMSVTGLGSMPGGDPLLAQQRIFDLLPGLPHLVELPDRGPGADLIGRSACMLTEMPIDLQPSGWRLVDRPGRDARRALALLDEDLDALAEAADGWTGALKLAAAGPWTLAATLELTRGDKALRDTGAVADLAASLADGMAAHVARVRGLIPGAELIVQLDEPSLPAIRSGHVRTASGFGALRVPEDSEIRAELSKVLDALPYPGVHCCAPAVPLGLLRESGAGWVALDTGQLRASDDERVGEALDAGLGLILGAKAGEGDAAVVALAHRLGFGAEMWSARTLFSPPCGLAGRAEPAAWELLRALPSRAEQVYERIGR